MNAVENQVRELVDVELAAANERFLQFHSQHEGYAVILEEYLETQEEMENMQYNMDALLATIRRNERAKGIVEIIGHNAERIACEAIQVAAMCQKFLEMEGKHDN